MLPDRVEIGVGLHPGAVVVAGADGALEAYALGCKGCTTYRPNPATGAVLETKPKPETAARANRGSASRNRPDATPARMSRSRRGATPPSDSI